MKKSYIKRNMSKKRDGKIFWMKLYRSLQAKGIQPVLIGKDGVAISDFENPMYQKWLEDE